ncbi:hypothetical protein CVUC_12920 [Caulobacter vibrioides]|nr:hypothetical protein CA608_17360 [Caulobacter vibrioides]PLR10971.1 hypothetical protein CVUC_12920 [Caulobacter vibrioides]
MNWANEKGAKSIRDYIAEAANIRNLVLYAQDRGIPKCEHVDGFIIERRRRVVVLLFAVIMVLQARQPQAFAAQALEAFLRVMRGVTQAGFDFASAEGGGRFKVITHLDPDGAQHISQIHAAESFYTFESRFSYKWSRGWSFGP